MSTYKVLKPIGYGGRIEKGEIVELPTEIAENFGSEYVELVSTETEKEIEQETEQDITKLTLAQLRIKAEELKLSTTGTKADLIERITLALDAAKEEEAEGNEDGTDSDGDEDDKAGN